MPTYHLIMLGDLALRSTETGQLVGATRRKPLAVLAILHVAGQSVDRDWLAQLLWPGDLRRARHSLAQTLYALNTELGQPVAESAANRLIANRVLIDSDWSKFNADVLAGRLESAVNEYGGPFLDGVCFRDCVDFDRWSESVRERLAETHRSAATRLADAAVPQFEHAPENAPMIVSIASVTTTGMSQPSRRTPKRRVLMTVLVGTIAAGAAFALVPRHHRPLSLSDELRAQNDWLFNRRTVSGRIFIETPVLQTPGPVGDSLVRLINSTLMQAVETSKLARAVPRDSVIAVEVAASREAFNSPVQRLARTDARLGVMTVVSVKDDSVRVDIAVQRLAPPIKLMGDRIPVADRLPAKFDVSPTHPIGWKQASVETHRLMSFTAPIGVPSTEMLRMKLALRSALVVMRSCDARAHAYEHALPWCWERDNEPVVVEGYGRAQAARIAMDRTLLEGRTTAP